MYGYALPYHLHMGLPTCYMYMYMYVVASCAEVDICTCVMYMYMYVLGYHSDISMFIGSHPSGQQSFNLNVQTPLRHDSCHDSFQSDTSLENSWHKDKALSPFCSVDQMQLSIHCHINAVKWLMCVPAQLQVEVGEWVDSDVCIWLFVQDMSTVSGVV